MADGLISVARQTLRLLPERAAFWQEAATLLVADPHFGKGAAFRSAGVPVPAGTTAENLSRLGSALSRFPVERLLILGDFLHAKEGRAPATLRTLEAWRAAHPDLKIVLVRGNHDRHAGDPPDVLGIACVEEPWVDRGLAFAHVPRPIRGLHVLGGHIHPAVRLVGRGRQRKRFPCFWFTPGVTVLPAFGDFTGSGYIEPAQGDRVFVVAGEEVLEVR